MELDDLKVAWAELDNRLARLETIAVHQREQRVVDRSRRVLATLGWGQAVQSLLWIGAIAVIAPFWIEHRHVPHLLVAGLALHVYGVLTICSSVVQILLILMAYWTAPVVSFQRQLAGLERLRIVSSLAIGLPWVVMWIPATMVAAKIGWNRDLYASSPEWILMNLAFGVAVMAVVVWIARRLAKNPPSSQFWCRVIDNLAGRSLVRASRRLQEIGSFDRD